MYFILPTRHLSLDIGPLDNYCLTYVVRVKPNDYPTPITGESLRVKYGTRCQCYWLRAGRPHGSSNELGWGKPRCMEQIPWLLTQISSHPARPVDHSSSFRGQVRTSLVHWGGVCFSLRNTKELSPRLRQYLCRCRTLRPLTLCDLTNIAITAQYVGLL